MPTKTIDLKFPYVGYSDFTPDKTDVPASFLEDEWKWQNCDSNFTEISS